MCEWLSRCRRMLELQLANEVVCYAEESTNENWNQVQYQRHTTNSIITFSWWLSCDTRKKTKKSKKKKKHTQKTDNSTQLLPQRVCVSKRLCVCVCLFVVVFYSLHITGWNRNDIEMTHRSSNSQFVQSTQPILLTFTQSHTDARNIHLYYPVHHLMKEWKEINSLNRFHTGNDSDATIFN